MKELLIAYLARTLNMSPESVAEMLFKKSDDETITDDLTDNALDALLQLDAKRVQALKPNTKEYFDNGYGKGKSETAAHFEKILRERFGVDQEGKLQGEALIDAISAAVADQGAKPDKIKASPEYLKLEATMRQQIEEARQQHLKELEKVRQEYAREQTWNQVRDRIREAVRKHPGLNQDAITDPMVDLLAERFKSYDYQLENGDFLPLLEGKRVENAQGYPRMLSDLVAEIAEATFPKIAQQPVGNAGNQNNNTGKAPVTGRFKDEDDFLEQRAQISDLEKRLELDKLWEAQKAGG
jgi:hypothetical protein